MDVTEMDVTERLKQHIEMLFTDVPRSRAAYELQDELLANSIERYKDLIKSGLTEEAAFQSVIESIGDVDELIAALPQSEDRLKEDLLMQENRERSALVLTISVGLYILAGVALLVGGGLSVYMGNDLPGIIGTITALVICIVPTCMLVYNAYAHPKYKKKKDTVVENFKQWNDGSKKAKQVNKAVSGLLWSLCVLVYLLISFTTGAWHITWIIFLAAGCVEGAINLIFKVWELKS